MIRIRATAAAAAAFDPASDETFTDRDGVASVTDGPFAETKEMLGAYGLIESLLRPAGPPSPAGG